MLIQRLVCGLPSGAALCPSRLCDGLPSKPVGANATGERSYRAVRNKEAHNAVRRPEARLMTCRNQRATCRNCGRVWCAEYVRVCVACVGPEAACRGVRGFEPLKRRWEGIHWHMFHVIERNHINSTGTRHRRAGDIPVFLKGRHQAVARCRPCP